MKDYLLRLGFAYLLLVIAQRVMKSAEKVLQETYGLTPADTTITVEAHDVPAPEVTA
jgi:hypothetical protein